MPPHSDALTARARSADDDKVPGGPHGTHDHLSEQLACSTGVRRKVKTDMPKNADLKNRVRKIMDRDGSTYQVALRVARAYPNDLGFPDVDEVTKQWLPEGAGRYGFKTFAQVVHRLSAVVTDETGADVSAHGNLILVTGECLPLPAEVLDWAQANEAVVFGIGQVEEAIESARSGRLSLLPDFMTDPMSNTRAFTAIRRLADATRLRGVRGHRSELAGVLRGCVDIHQLRSGHLLLSAARFAQYPNRRQEWMPKHDAGPTVSVFHNAELLVRLGLATATEIVYSGYSFTDREAAYLYNVESYFSEASPR